MTITDGKLQVAGPPAGPGESIRRRGMFFLCLAAAGAGFATILEMALTNNYVREVMNIDWAAKGVMEGFREACGISALLLLAVLAGLAEPLVGAAMLLLFSAGLAAFAYAPNYFWLVVLSMVWSQGLHVWMPLPQSMALALAPAGRKGRSVGRVQAAVAVGSGVGLAAALLLHTRLGVEIRPLYVLAAGAALLAAAACLGIPRRIKTPGPRLVFRRKYALYYLLSFLEGWRKQIFAAFAGFLLVTKYHTPLVRMLWMWLAIQVIGWAASPLVGRLIDRVGERKVLVSYFACLTVLFIGYGFIPDVRVLYGLYVADSALFVLAMGLTTYVGRIAPPTEYTPTLSMGVAMNHVAAVIMPLISAVVLAYAGYQWVFLMGSAAAAASVAAALRIPRREQPPPHAGAEAGAEAGAGAG